MPKSWYLPETPDSAVDTIEDIAFILDFLSDIYSQENPEPIKLSADGDAGLYFLLSFMRDSLEAAVGVLAKAK